MAVHRLISNGSLVLLAMIGLVLTSASTATANRGSRGSGDDAKACPAPLVVGNGLSMSTNAKAAGIEAAKKAKAALGKQAAKVVLVFDSQAVKNKAEMLAGVCSVFDSSIVYGCPGYAPLTEVSNTGNVGVLALGGRIAVTAAVSDLADGHRACGERIGKALEQASKAKAPGRLLILFGDCHVPKDDDLVKGACGVLGKSFPAIGGASSGDVYFKGKVVGKSNLGVLLTGCFKCSFAMKKDNSPEGLIFSARDAFVESMGKSKAALMLTFDCGGRRGKLGANLPKELEAMKSVAGKTPIFGLYGSGEIGHKGNGTPSCGDGYHVSVCALAPCCPSENCCPSEGGASGVFGIRRDGSYYTRIEWASHTVQNCLYWICNLIDDDTKRAGGTWGANTMGPANAVLSFFGETQEIGSLRIFHNVGAAESLIEELASVINIYVGSDDKAARFGDEKTDPATIAWTKVKECKMAKKEHWAEFTFDRPVKAKYVRVELVKNHGTPPDCPWTETSEIKFYPPAS